MFDRHQRTLAVQGAVFDVIDGESDSTWDHYEGRSEMPVIMSRLIRQLDARVYQVTTYPTNDMPNVLLRTLLAFASSDRDEVIVNSLQLFQEHKAYLDVNPHNTETPDKFQLMIAEAKDCIRTRKLCLTRKCYVSLVPSEARLGDSICIILGDTTPFILCLVGTRWQLIGDAYIHSIMRGEGMNFLDGETRDTVLV